MKSELRTWDSESSPRREGRKPRRGRQPSDFEYRILLGLRRRGFTLIEVLLAVAVFAIVLLAIHGVFFGALRLRNKTVSTLERAVPLQHALAILRRDVANIVPPGGTLFGEFQTTPTTSTSNSMSTSSSSGVQSQASQGVSAFNSASMRGLIVSPSFCTATGIISDNAPWAEVERVLYYLAEPTNHTVGKDLVRSVTRNLLPTLQDQPEDQRLLSGVLDVAFSYYDGTAWQEVWDSTMQTTKLPQAIKVEVQLASQESEQVVWEPITMVVPLQVQARTNQTAQASGGAQ